MATEDASREDTADALEPRHVERTAPSDAFDALGNEIRTAVLRKIDDEGPCSFSTLAAESDAETSAGFAYHLRQLDGRYVRKREDERYELTAAGREVARAMDAGAVTVSVDHDPVDLDERCPRCGDRTLQVRIRDNVARVACSACEAGVLELPLPPGGSLGRDPNAIPDALDAYHRHRVRSFADGVCPDCGGPADASVEDVTGDGGDRDGAAEWPPGGVRLSFGCETCGSTLDCPATVRVLDHPEVVSFYRDHGRDVSDRPLWNVGPEWRERLVSTDPRCVLVSTRLDDEVLEVFLSGDGRVAGSQRRPLADGPGADETDAAGSEAGADDAGSANASEPSVPDAPDDAAA